MAAPLILARTFKDAHAFAQNTLGLSIGHYRVVNSPGTIKAVRGTKLYLVEGWDKRPDRFSMKSAIRYCRNEVIDVATMPAEEPESAIVHAHLAGDVLHDVPEGSASTEEEAEVTCEFCLEIIDTLPRDKPTTIEITVVPDDTPTPQHHLDMVAAVLPGKTTDFFDEPDDAEVKPACLDCGLEEGHTDDCPQVDPFKIDPSEPDVVDKPRPTVVTPEAEALAAQKPKAKRRTRCKSCGNLHFKDEACPTAEDA